MWRAAQEEGHSSAAWVICSKLGEGPFHLPCRHACAGRDVHRGRHQRLELCARLANHWPSHLTICRQMPSVLATETELANLGSLERIRDWCAIPAQTWQAFSAFVGTLPNVRVLSQVPQSSLLAALKDLRINTTGGAERELKPVELIQFGLAWRVARQVFQLPDIDPLTDPLPLPPQQTEQRIFGAISIEEGEILLGSRSIGRDGGQCFVSEGTGPSLPLSCRDDGRRAAHRGGTHPRANSCAETEGRGSSGGPVCRFRRMQKQMKAWAWVLQADGTFKGLDVPSPPSFEAWSACWKVYRSAIFMLRFPSSAAGGAYISRFGGDFGRISRLSSEFPETWHLIMQAEDRCRTLQNPHQGVEFSPAYLGDPTSMSSLLGWVFHFCGKRPGLLERARAEACPELH